MDRAFPRTDLLAHRRETTPDRTALIDAETGDSWTFRELDTAVDRVAGGLDRVGVGPDTRVGTLLGTRPATVRLVHAVQRLDGVLVPLHARQPASELRDPAERADVDLVVCEASTAEQGAELSSAVGDVVTVDEVDGLHQLPASNGAFTDDGDWDDDDLAVVLFTSGTTGRPKGVRLTRGNLRASAEASAYRLGVDPGDRWLCCLPMYHMGGLAPVFRTALYGTTLVLQREFDAEATAEVIDRRGITGVSLVPTMLTRLLDAGWHPPEHLDTVLLGGAPATPDLLERALERGVPVYPTYGTTETASQIATARPEQVRADPETVGQPLVNTTVEIVDDGGTVPAGETGEVVVSGPTVAAGYLDEDRSSEAFGPDGFHTGDLGVRGPEGRLRVVGRVDDLIVTGGENVAPATVESALRVHQGVEDVAVVGIEDAEWGERVAALVVGETDAADLDAHCRERLAGYQCPKQYGFAGELPRTASGTVDRRAVRERLRADDRNGGP
jgi:O-succinylbenzoic acid--CoA ligase